MAGIEYKIQKTEWRDFYTVHLTDGTKVASVSVRPPNPGNFSTGYKIWDTEGNLRGKYDGSLTLESALRKAGIIK